MKEITLYGAGGHSYAAVALIRSLGDYRPVVVLDDNPGESDILGVPVKQFDRSMLGHTVCLTLGDNAVRKRIAETFPDREYPVFVHESVVSYPSATLGEGSVVLPQATLDADVSIGRQVVINNNAVLSHNVRVADYAHIAIQAAVAGNVEIGEGALIGAGSVLLPGIKIGNWAVVGAGAVVTKDVPPGVVVVGNPARVKK